MSLFAENPSAALMRKAISDSAFCRYFTKFGGGYDLVESDHLYTRSDRIDDFCMTDEEYLSRPHYYMPMVDGHPINSYQIKALLNDFTLQEIREMGRPISESDLKSSIRSRQYQREHVWGFYVAYLHDLPPQHPSATRLVRESYQTAWAMNEMAVAA